MEEAQTDPASSPGIESQQDGPHLTITDSLSDLTLKNSEESIPNTVTTNHSSSSRDTAVNLTSPLHSNEIKQATSFVPYALKWTEHETALRPVTPLTSSKPAGATSSVFPRLEHSCNAIPNTAGDFIIFGGKVKPDKEEVWSNDVILLSITDMSLTSLETNGAKPRTKSGHRAVIAGRVLVIFGGSNGDSYLHFLNLDTREWSNLRPPAPYPGPRYGHSLMSVNNTIWLYGGGITGNKLDDMWCIDLGTDGVEYARWREIPKKEPWPEGRSYHST
ncbi:Negative regulator of mitotic exit, partial [Tulasnella sp. 417]